MTSGGAKSLKVLPHSLEAEKGVLGSILLDPITSINKCFTKKLIIESFYARPHQILYEALIQMDQTQEIMDAVTILNWLNEKNKLDLIGGSDYLLELQESTIVPNHIESYCDIVIDKHLCRKLIQKSSEAINSVYKAEDDAAFLINKAQESLFELNSNGDEKIEPWKDSVQSAFSEIENMDPTKVVTGVNTGFIDLNKQLGGFQKTDMIVLAARPAMGKTSLALNIVEHAALGDKSKKIDPVPVAVFSLEMSREQLVKRMLFSNARIGSEFFRGSKMSKDHHERLVKAANTLKEAKIYIDDTPGLDVSELRGRARRLKERYGVELIVIDYLQLMNDQSKANYGRQLETMAISGAIKGVAKELNIPVIVISQLSRATEGRNKNEPKLSDLRDSGAIEQDADIVMLLYRESYYDDSITDNGAKLDIAKFRHGSTGKINLIFQQSYTRFDNAAPDFNDGEVS